ncbi:hypothetical protein [Desulforamulus hydrothermalis]|uniref:Uncharacterized protein n=1 Tax=Desulforamulus hydrothermalis Lam5 = DSM 18033 TaxID=1121428 RepID=K8E6B6_9FIRM|nr:hypothetical protein [Desulforamulus hydrothermalis]CCO07008.1 hypothetical protein DESHY_10168 [Desulforamulus hydrothermalis Lam5 = DSM 18033]SHG97736.1 hypothetical protein SAMN02745177_00975 [Desulforamulus hydrothermalis Lam5 = DSM 18033]
MIKGAQLPVAYQPAAADSKVTQPEVSLTEEVLAWLEHEDTPAARRTAQTICVFGGVFLAAQIIRFFIS